MKAIATLLCVGLVGVLVTGLVGAADKGKDVTLKGTILCAKCALGEAKKCTTAIQVKEGDETVTYLFLDKGSKEKYHEDVCGGDKKEGTVMGKVSKKDGKNYITPTKVTYAKK